MHCILTTNINICRGENTTRRKKGQIFASTMYSAVSKPAYLQKVDSKLDEPCNFLRSPLQTNLFWREIKILKKMYLKSNTRQENFRTFQENDRLDYQPLFGKMSPHSSKTGPGRRRKSSLGQRHINGIRSD